MTSPLKKTHATTTALDIDRIRADFPILSVRARGKPLASCDAAKAEDVPTEKARPLSDTYASNTFGLRTAE